MLRQAVGSRSEDWENGVREWRMAGRDQTSGASSNEFEYDDVCMFNF
jgi:hypothetical protein